MAPSKPTQTTVTIQFEHTEEDFTGLKAHLETFSRDVRAAGFNVVGGPSIGRTPKPKAKAKPAPKAAKPKKAAAAPKRKAVKKPAKKKALTLKQKIAKAKKASKDATLTQQELADMFGVSRHAIRKAQ